MLLKDTSKLGNIVIYKIFPNRVLTLSVKAFKNKKDNSDPKNGLFELITLKSISMEIQQCLVM